MRMAVLTVEVLHLTQVTGQALQAHAVIQVQRLQPRQVADTAGDAANVAVVQMQLRQLRQAEDLNRHAAVLIPI